LAGGIFNALRKRCGKANDIIVAGRCLAVGCIFMVKVQLVSQVEGLITDVESKLDACGFSLERHIGGIFSPVYRILFSGYIPENRLGKRA
jgi:hypothetical protein